jgi:hypothetical protein
MFRIHFNDETNMDLFDTAIISYKDNTITGQMIDTGIRVIIPMTSIKYIAEVDPNDR